MTIKQIAESTGKTERTVRRWVEKLADKMTVIKDKMSASSPLYPADFDLSETLDIIETGMGKNARMIYENNAAKEPQNTLSTDDRIDRLERVMAGMISTMETMAKGFEMLANERVKKIEAPKKETNSLKEASALKYNPRMEINNRVRDYAIANRVPYAVVWSSLYRELGYQLRIDLRERAGELGMPIIDYIESIGEMPALIEISEFMLK